MTRVVIEGGSFQRKDLSFITNYPWQYGEGDCDHSAKSSEVFRNQFVFCKFRDFPKCNQNIVDQFFLKKRMTNSPEDILLNTVFL